MKQEKTPMFNFLKAYALPIVLAILQAKLAKQQSETIKPAPKE
ncbi:hypothetical protein [Xanthomonas phage XAJ2]|uniref:Uncharacterized protein n=1 Tax=Xanthomonas phage XAJ2 TaxID=1775249 RepID=A0A1I9L2K6_9CAUD|nr:hypothetical protein [Xanthomonas phage XAJ2]